MPTDDKGEYASFNEAVFWAAFLAAPDDRPPLLRGHFWSTFRVAAREGFYCTPIPGSSSPAIL